MSWQRGEDVNDWTCERIKGAHHILSFIIIPGDDTGAAFGGNQDSNGVESYTKYYTSSQDCSFQRWCIRILSGFDPVGEFDTECDCAVRVIRTLIL